MGLFDNLEKLINEHGSSTILKERLLLAEDKYSTVVTKLTEANSEIERLRFELEQIRKECDSLRQASAARTAGRPIDFDANTEKILKLFFDANKNQSVDSVARLLGLQPGIVKYHFDILQNENFIDIYSIGVQTMRGSTPPEYGLTPAGRAYVVKKLSS